MSKGKLATLSTISILISIISITSAGIIYIPSWFESIENDEKIEMENKLEKLKIKFKENPTFVNEYNLHKLSDFYEREYAKNYDSDNAHEFLVKHVQNYEGKNGYTDIITAIRLTFLAMNTNYGDTLEHPSTSWGWHVPRIPTSEVPANYKSVIFFYKTLDYEIELDFWVNTSTGDVTYGNQHARQILNTVN